MRRWLGPPSRVRCQRSASASPGLKGTPRSASRSITAGAFSTTNSTALRLLSPAPAVMVSSRWLSNVAPGSSTAAIPPCAQAVEPAEMSALARTITLALVARLSAAVRPAAPDPITITSASNSAIGRRPRQIEENIVQIRLLRRNVDDAEPRRRQRAKPLARVHLALVVADRNGALAGGGGFRELGRAHVCNPVP